MFAKSSTFISMPKQKSKQMAIVKIFPRAAAVMNGPTNAMPAAYFPPDAAIEVTSPMPDASKIKSTHRSNVIFRTCNTLLNPFVAKSFVKSKHHAAIYKGDNAKIIPKRNIASKTRNGKATLKTKALTQMAQPEAMTQPLIKSKSFNAVPISTIHKSNPKTKINASTLFRQFIRTLPTPFASDKDVCIPSIMVFNGSMMASTPTPPPAEMPTKPAAVEMIGETKKPKK